MIGLLFAVLVIAHVVCAMVGPDEYDDEHRDGGDDEHK